MGAHRSLLGARGLLRAPVRQARARARRPQAPSPDPRALGQATTAALLAAAGVALLLAGWLFGIAYAQYRVNELENYMPREDWNLVSARLNDAIAKRDALESET